MTHPNPADPSPQGRLDFPDFAKGFAILGIVLFHYLRGYFAGWADHAVTAGGAGVHLFLMLSGFGLTLSGNPPVNPLSFYKRRALKVLVPYFIAITLIFIVNQLMPLYPNRGWYAWLGHLLLFKMFDERIVNSFGGHFWFLSTLVQLYLAYPFLAAMQKRLQPALFLLTALAISLIYGGLLAVTGKADLKVYNSFFLQYLWEFCTGMLLARRFADKDYAFWRQPIAILAAGAIVGMLLTAVLALRGGPVGKMFNDIPSAMGITCLAALTFALLNRFARPVKRAVQFIGGISYELYLTHMLVWGAILAGWAAYGAGPVVLPMRLLALGAACAVAYGYRSLLAPVCVL
ncbi:MAG: acyltransferase [Desulfobacterales bacterium]|nr:acyltransferase [Desulfobacterales bacterium]